MHNLVQVISAAARFHESLSARLWRVKFRPSCADPNLWMRQLRDGSYNYIVRYVDDVMCFSNNRVGYPRFYLGGDVVEFPPSWKSKNVSFCLSAHTYIKNCVGNLELRMYNTTFKHENIPMNPLYNPEIDKTALCSPSNHPKYRSLSGGANWMITLGCLISIMLLIL